MKKDLRTLSSKQKKIQVENVSKKKDTTSTPFQELIYLDVAQQEVAAVEDPTLGEIAEGDPDTSVPNQKPSNRK